MHGTILATLHAFTDPSMFPYDEYIGYLERAFTVGRLVEESPNYELTVPLITDLRQSNLYATCWEKECFVLPSR